MLLLVYTVTRSLSNGKGNVAKGER